MRPQLRDDVRFVECPDGAYVHSDYGACTLRGRQAYAWLTRLAPVLTGRHTLGELTAGLPGDRKTMVERLVGRLAEQRFVVDARRAAPHGLTETELRTYAEEIAFIGYALDSPEERFERIRNARLVLAGAGPLLEALAAACAGSGWRHMTVAGPEPERVRPAVDAARRDSAQEFRTVSIDAQAITADADVVLQVSADLDELVATARACEAAGIVLGQAFAGPAEVWISPVGRPSETEAESGWLRLAGLPAATPAPPGEDLMIGPVPTVVAAILALACFSRLTGLDTGSERELVRVDLRSLDTLPHRFLAHPRAVTTAAGPRAGASAEGLTQALAALRTAASAEESPADQDSPAAQQSQAVQASPAAQDGPARQKLSAAEEKVEADVLLGLASELVDPRLGVLGLLDEEALAQSPLAVCRAVVSDPYGVLPGWAPAREAFGWGPDQRTARLRCLLAALAAYGVPDGSGQGVELPDGRPRTLPAPGLVSTTHPPVGTGAGLSWMEALAAGLRSHCERLLRDRIATGPSSAPIDPRQDQEAAALLRQLTLAGQTPDIHDSTAVLGVPAVTLTVPGQEALVSAAPTLTDALRDGLERLLLRWQSRAPGQHAYARLHPLWPPGGDPSRAVTTMTAALRRAGWTPVAVPLHGDPEVSGRLPFVARVVLLDD